MPYIGRELDSGNYLKLDDISSSFNGSTTTFNLTAGGKAFFPGSAFSILVSLAGVTQEPEAAYQISNSQITFATAPASGDQFFCIVLGVALGVSVPGNGTVDGAQLAKPFNYDGYFYLDDANNRVGVGTATPAKPLHVVGEGQFDSVRVLGDLQVDGTTTTLDTVVTEVDKLEVGANNSTVGVAITQSGSGDILNLYDSSSSVFSVADGGTVTASGDISIADKIIHTGDTNTAIRFPAVDTVTVETSGSERFRVTSAGNVGIGSLVPVGKLDVAGNVRIFEPSSTAARTLRITNSSQNLFLGVEGTSGGGNIVGSSAGDGTLSVNGNLRISANNGASANVSLLNSGSVGIGTITPQSQFEVYGSSPIVRSKHSTSQKYTQINHNGTDGYVDWSSGNLILRGASNTERLRITSGGLVGIGTNNPGAALHVLSTAYPTATIQRDHDVNYPRLRIVNTANDGADLDGIGDGTGGFRISCVAAGVSTERLRITSEGKILIGIQNPRAGVFNTNLITPQFQMESAGTVDHNRMMTLVSNPGAQAGYTPTFIFGKSRGSTAGSFTGVANNDSLGQISFQGADGSELVEAARISAAVAGVTGTNDMPGRLVFSTTADGESGPTERMRIYADGGVSFKQYAEFANQADDGFSGYIGSAGIIAAGGSGNDLAVRSGQHLVFTTGGSTEKMRLNSTGNLDVGANGGSSSGTGLYMQPNGQAYLFTASSLDALNIYLGGSRNAWINSSGSATFTGALSKGSGSFKISHPLPAKTKTHHLVHSFIEGPQADLIYRGYVDLVDGQATVNVDTASRMTEGTFEVLCSNVSCFTSNESDWTAVKGSVTGNVLTITAQDATATSKVSWMVVGERKDQHMLDTEWTDDAGRVITEPEKVVEATEESETESG